MKGFVEENKDKLTNKNIHLVDYYIYQNLIKSILKRKQGEIIHINHDCTLLLYGLSVFIGGNFSKQNGEKVINIIKGLKRPLYIYTPNNSWSSLIQNRFTDKIYNKQIKLYKFDDSTSIPNCNDEKIITITQDLFDKKILNSNCILDELYSYNGVNDFLQNGLGVVLVINNKIVGYCLSEYSVKNSIGANIWINEQFRGLGYAKKLTNAFLLNCKKNNKTVYWVCNDDNIKSNNLAISTGFKLKSAEAFLELQ